MSPLEIWCNEAQERYVLALAPDRLAEFAAHVRARALSVRRRSATRPPTAGWWSSDSQLGERAVDIPLA